MGLGGQGQGGTNGANNAEATSDYERNVFTPRSNEIVIAKLRLQSVTLRGLQLASIVIAVGSN